MTSNVRGVYRKYLVRSPHPMMICILYLQKLVKTVVFVCGRLPYKEVMDAPRMCTISKRDVNHLAKSQRKRLLPQLPVGNFVSEALRIFKLRYLDMTWMQHQGADIQQVINIKTCHQHWNHT